MKKQLTLIVIIGMLLVVGLSGCFEEEPKISNSNPIKIQILVVSRYFNNESIWEWNNESYIIEVREGEYFGVPDNSIIIVNKTYCNISDGKQLFKLVEIIDESHAKIQFNESAFYNYTITTSGFNPARDPTWDIIRNYFENPFNISIKQRVIYPKIGTQQQLQWSEPNEYVEVYLNIVVPSPGKVTITTDNGIYNSDTGINDDHIQGDIINITIINHLDRDIFFDKWFIIPFCSLYFEIYNNGSWELYDDILGVAEYPASFTFQDWIEDATKLSPNESSTFQYSLSHSSGFKMFQGKYRFVLEYFCIPDEQLVNYSNVEFATYRIEANFVTIYSNNFTIMNFPIDSVEEALS
jgi:hypothetical protein